MFTKRPKVSVIIPAYNEEKYLRRCLDTVVNQTLQEIEIILIDDGSTDSTPKICDEYKNKFPSKVVVIHKTNEGQGMARNVGLDVAHGEYIGFADADDWIETDMFSRMYEKAIKNDSDMVVCDVRKIFVQDDYEAVEKSLPKSTNKIDIGYYIKDGLNPAYAWNKLFKREIWNKYRFKKMVYEDLDIILTIDGNCNSISYIQEPFYSYYKRAGSTTTSYNKIQLLDIMTAYRDASYNANSKYKDETIFCVAKRILKNLATPGMIVYKADFIELINELSKDFIENKYIKEDPNIRVIYDYFNNKTLPKSVFYSNFGGNKNNYNINESKKNWSKFTRDISFIELNQKNCDIDNAPKIIRSEYLNGNYDFVEDYFKLYSLYKNGGIAIDGDFKFSSPLGKLRAEYAFFYFDSNLKISSRIFGAQKGCDIIKKLLMSYGDSENYLQNGRLLSLSERLENVLREEGLVLNNLTQRLKNNIVIFKSEL